jgi:hypothetical protein
MLEETNDNLHDADGNLVSDQWNLSQQKTL